MIQIAIYGKGGIGKSTVSANISYQLSKKGKKVVQIGCDPKHDSTRLLLKGKRQTTVLEHIRDKGSDPKDVVCTGSNGISCIEAGGPEPGIGCAGRGILTAFDFLETHDLVPSDTDVVLYDVLGDVVCGGFAVPLRKKYADAVFIVTSGEFMSLYAANNVLKGIRNFDRDCPRVCGLILNCRGIKDEMPYVKNFADAVGLPIVTVIPRSEDFRTAESNGITVSEMDLGCESSRNLAKIADVVEELIAGRRGLHEACPLDDDSMDLVAKGIKVARNKGEMKVPRCLAVSRRDTYRGCGSALAAHWCGSVEDADIIIHGPSSCGYYFMHLRDSLYVRRGYSEHRSAEERFFCTDMKDSTSILGGNDLLRRIIEQRIEAGTKLMFVITTCVPGIIGDDSLGVATEAMKAHPGVRIICAPVDGIMNGSRMAHFISIKAVCELVDKNVKPVHGLVNIIGTTEPVDSDIMDTDQTEEILGMLGYKVNCRFIYHNSSSEIREIRKAELTLKYSRSVAVEKISAATEEYAGIPQYPSPLPQGISECRSWVREFCERMNISKEKMERALSELEREFSEGMDGKERMFEGKRVALLTNTYTSNMWILDILEYMGAEIVCVMCTTNSKWFETDDMLHLPEKYRVIYDVDLEKAEELVKNERIQAVFGPERVVCRLPVPHFTTSSGTVGVRSQLVFSDRFAAMAEVEHI